MHKYLSIRIGVKWVNNELNNVKKTYQQGPSVIENMLNLNKKNKFLENVYRKGAQNEWNCT